MWCIIDDAHTWGGAQIALSRAALAIRDQTGEQVIIASGPANQKKIKAIVGENDFIFVDYPSALPGNIFLFWLRLFRANNAVSRTQEFGECKYLLNMSGLEFCLSAALVLKARRVKFVCWLHNTEKLSVLIKRAGFFKSLINMARDKLTELVAVRLFSCVATPSLDAAALLKSRVGKIDVKGALYPPMHPSLANSKSRIKYLDYLAEVEVAVVARIDFGHKNQSLALKTCEELNDRGFKISLKFIGDGPDYDSLKHLIAEKKWAFCTTMVGWCEDPWAELSANSLLLVPSNYESFGLVLHEALSRGYRLVATPLNVFKELVPPIFLSHGKSPELMADCVEKVLKADAKQLESETEPYLQIHSATQFVAALSSIHHKC